jgi:hypothetical protein
MDWIVCMVDVELHIDIGVEVDGHWKEQSRNPPLHWPLTYQGESESLQ